MFSIFYTMHQLGPLQYQPIRNRHCYNWLEEANITMPAEDEDADFWRMYHELED